MSFVFRCDKSHAMKIARVLLIVLPLVAVGACSGGGGSTSATTHGRRGQKFRHDINNSGAGNGSIADNNGVIKWQTQIDTGRQSPRRQRLACRCRGGDVNGVLYIATEGGTLAALAADDGRHQLDRVQLRAPGTTEPLTCPRARLARWVH